MDRRIFPFKTKLVRTCGEVFGKQRFQDELKYFRRDWRDRNPTIVGDVSHISLIVFDNWDHESKAKLGWNKRVRQHSIEKVRQSFKQIKRRMVKVLSTETVLIAAFPCFYGADGVHDMFDGDVIITAFARRAMSFFKLTIFG